ncbi:hypothetical protein [Microtetraspora malaysiensis]|uniref:hypothetical protein n=1 Tax=Microtetraspora malaysiensis TaxID=161358 RepID=UPI003D8FA0DE
MFEGASAAILHSYSFAGVAAAPSAAGFTTFNAKSLAVRTMDDAPADGVMVSVAAGNGPSGDSLSIWAATEAEGEGVETAAVAVVGLTDATTVGCSWIHAPAGMSSGAASGEAARAVMVNVAVNCVPTVADAGACRFTVKSWVTAVCA